MNICIPVEEDRGLQSPVCQHFGSAPLFMLVDTDSRVCRALPNRNTHHSPGMCMPLASLSGEQIDAVVVGGIGMGALNKLMQAGVEVFLSEFPSVEETVNAQLGGNLQRVTPETACQHHGRRAQGRGTGGGCGSGSGRDGTAARKGGGAGRGATPGEPGFGRSGGWTRN